MNIRQILFYFFCILCLVQCKKKDDVAIPSTTQTDSVDSVGLDYIDDDVQDFLSGLKPVNMELKDFTLPDGQSVQDFLEQYRKQGGGRSTQDFSSATQKKNIIISLMLERGRMLADKNQNIFYDGKTTQKGIAYSYGSKDYKPLSNPTSGSCNLEKDTPSFHGIDCSGFIYDLASAAGIDLGKTEKIIRKNINAEKESNPEFWQNAIQSKGNNYNLITVEDVTSRVGGDINLLEKGDIVFFYDFVKAKNGALVKAVSHIGFVWKESGETLFINSYGDPHKDCPSHFLKGPGILPVKGFSKHKIGALRLVVPANNAGNPIVDDTAPSGEVTVTSSPAACTGKIDPSTLIENTGYTFNVHFSTAKEEPMLCLIMPKDGGGYTDGFFVIERSPYTTDVVRGGLIPYVTITPPLTDNLNRYYNHYDMAYLDDPSIKPTRQLYSETISGTYQFFVACKKSDGKYIKSKTVTLSTPFVFGMDCQKTPKVNFTVSF